MFYSLDIAPIEQNIIRQAVQGRLPIPDNILNAPELLEGLQVFLQAFFDLNSERPIGFSIGRIPGSAVRSYARDFEFDDEQTSLLNYYITEMDNAYLKREAKKQKNGESARPSKQDD